MLNLLPALDIPFRMHDQAGVVAVAFGVNHDPVATGHDLVAVGYDEGTFRGFPVVECRVDYSGTGYRGLCGWLQIVDRSEETGMLESSVDLLPALAHTDSPMCYLGYLPTFFDAPANPDHPNGRWIAETFLVELRARQPWLRAVAGLRWGYELTDGRAAPIPPEQAAPSAWDERRAFLEARFPRWTFAPVGSS